MAENITTLIDIKNRQQQFVISAEDLFQHNREFICLLKK